MMRRVTRIVLAMVAGFFLGSAGTARAAIMDVVQIDNLTGSAGVHNVPYTDSDFPVATAVTWTHLTLTLNFNDGTHVAETLYDSSNVAQTSLAAGGILSTASFDPSAHVGGLNSVSFNYIFPTATVDIYTAALPSTTTTPVSISTALSGATAPLSTGQSVDIVAFNADPNTGASYNDGTMTLLPAPATATPEPSSFILFGMAVTGLGVARWRKRK